MPANTSKKARKPVWRKLITFFVIVTIIVSLLGFFALSTWSVVLFFVLMLELIDGRTIVSTESKFVALQHYFGVGGWTIFFALVGVSFFLGYIGISLGEIAERIEDRLDKKSAGKLTNCGTLPASRVGSIPSSQKRFPANREIDMSRAVLHALAQAIVVLIGTIILVLFVSFLFGSLILEPVKALCSLVFEEVTGWRLARAIELLLYGCMGIVVFRYLARFFPQPCAVGKTMYGWLRTSSGIVAAVVAIIFASIGTFSYPGSRLVPTLVFVVTLGALVWSRSSGKTFLHPAGTVLFLRRFASFADRSVVSSVLRAAPRGGNVTFLVAAQEPASNWDPWSLGFAGFRLLNPVTSIPTYHVSSDEAWGENVSLLIREARCVAMDLSDFSASITHELRLVVEHSKLSRAVFVARDGVDKTVLLSKLQEVGVNPQAISDRLYFYRASWPRTLLRVLLMTISAALVAVLIWVMVVPSSVIIRVVEAVFLGMGILVFCRDIVLRFSIAGRSKREIRSRIRQALAESAADYPASSVATDVFEATFGGACGALVIGFLFAALGYSDFTLGNLLGATSPGPYHPEQAADWSQLGAFLGVVLGVVIALIFSRTETRRYCLRKTVTETLLGTGIMLAVMAFLVGGSYLLLRIQGQQERLLASIEYGRGLFWMLFVLVLAVGIGWGRQFGRIEEIKR